MSSCDNSGGNGVRSQHFSEQVKDQIPFLHQQSPTFETTSEESVQFLLYMRIEYRFS